MTEQRLTCTKCGVEKDGTEFPVAQQMGYAAKGKCSLCTRATSELGDLAQQQYSGTYADPVKGAPLMGEIR